MENEVLDEILRRFDKAVTEARITYGEYDIVVLRTSWLMSRLAWRMRF
jgi:hypothetical protein